MESNLKQYMIVAYYYLIIGGKYILRPAKEDTRPVVPEEYRESVSAYLAEHNFDDNGK